MDNRIIFREMLTEIKKAADEAGGTLSQEEVKEILKGMPLEETHFQLIYDYLAEQNIRVVKSGEEEDEALPDEGGQSLALYLEDLSALSDLDEGAEAQLIERVRSGDEEAKERLVELYLPLICTMAGEYEDETLSAEDLIQEGNMGLLMAVQSLAGYASTAACRAHMLNSIREAMETSARGMREHHSLDDGLVSRLNHLNEAIHNLERDLGHRVSAEELSAYLEMPLEEIESLLRMSGGQIGLGK